MGKKRDLGREKILGIVLLFISLLSFFSLISSHTGLIGSLIRNVLFFLFGFASYIIPIIGLVLSFNVIKKKKLIDNTIIFLFFLVLSLTLIIEIYNGQDIISFRTRLLENRELASEGLGAGFIGSVLGHLFLSLFGIIGTYLMLVLSLVLVSLYIIDIDFKNIGYKVKSFYFDSKNNIKKWFDDKLNFDKKDKDKDFNNTIVGDELEELKDIVEDEDSEFLIDISKEDKSNDFLIIDDYKKKNLQKEKINRRDEAKNYCYPPLSLLKKNKLKDSNVNDKLMKLKASRINETMKNFNIDAQVSKINIGPSITCFELEPAPGVKVSKILSLNDDLALALASSDIRIEAPIPGKAAIGIEVPNKEKEAVLLRDILELKEFSNSKVDLPLVLGKDISGKPIVSSIDKMPHLLIAGATGSGKSVCINSIIISILYKCSPDEVKLMLIDPKVVELSVYNDIPHLLLPVVTKAENAKFALKWAVEEMENRYNLFANNKVRDIEGYNNMVGLASDKKMSKIVIIIDELADLMLVAANEIEDYISRLAQMARAAGIYLIIATQRPSVDVITGTIKANIPSRISFSVSSQIDSRTILDMAGAEKLLGQGDMLFLPSGYSKPKRIQGTFVSDDEITNIVKFLKDNNKIKKDSSILKEVRKKKEFGNLQDEVDELLPKALELIIREDQASISLLQRRLGIGYNRAANIMDYMEENNMVGKSTGNKPRKVLVSEEVLKNYK